MILMNAEVLYCLPILVQTTVLKVAVETAWQLIKYGKKWMI